MKDIRLLWVYTSTMQPNGPGVKPHSHADYYQVLCMLDGTLNVELGEEEYLLHVGDIVVVPKGVTHRFWNEASVPSHYYDIKFTVLNRQLNQLLDAVEEHILQDSFSFQLVDQIAKEYMHGQILKDESASAALLTLLFAMTSSVRHSEKEEYIIDTTGYTALSKKVIAYLSDHYSESLSLDDISNGVGTTKNYLCNAFKRNTGITIIDCLNMIRIRKAAELIVYSDLPLAQVAQMCGYVSTSHFNRVFLRYVGVPPGQCRRAYPYDVLLRENKFEKGTNAFMYNVLAGKTIPQDVITEFERNKAESNDSFDDIK